MESVKTLFGRRYNPDLKAYTRLIQTSPQKVAALGKAYAALFEIDPSLDIHGGDDQRQGQFNWDATEEQDALFLKVVESLENLHTFLKGMNDYLDYLKVTNHGPEVTMELGWQDRRAGRVVWDRWTQSVEDPVMAYVLVADQFDLAFYECAPISNERAEPPMYRYHPERYKANRTYAETIGKMFRQRVDPRTGFMTIDQLNESMGHVVRELNAKAMNHPRRLTLDGPGPSLIVDAEQTLCTAYGRFVQAGRQIMDFPPSLTEMLSKTDIDDIPLNTIRMPYASQYVHFGPQPELELEPGWLVDGAYVEQRGEVGDLRITVTAMPKDHADSEKWFVRPEPEFSQDFVGEFRTMDLATAIDTVLAERLAAIGKAKERAGGNITKEVQAEAAATGHEIPKDLDLVDIGPQMAGVREDVTRLRFPVYKAAIQLVVNALCYVAAYPDDIDTAWPAGTPDALLKKAVSGVGKEQARARSKLSALGYVPVHICGKRIAEQRDRLNLAGTTVGGMAAHWRRGHWRNQVHGQGRSLRKLIWMMPMLVGAKEKDDAEFGHLYLVT
ncbi:hypothetical protein [Diaphorobacter caeni]|uniref:hypothetical protein n=1 Tax=Diaphorobacter caeni TaxID=2784387 RepID=UPI0018909C3B|nr:hypothetical protein [Diaphorobacter caeni]MBF5007806.1 hypothetical protein [Diaphorobacter caeni]